MTDVTISALPAAASIADSDLMVVVEIGTPNITKRATAAQMRATSLPLSGGTITGALTLNTTLSVGGAATFTATATMNAGGGWSSANVGKQLLLTTPAASSNPALAITDLNGTNLWGVINAAGTLQLASMPAYSNGVTAPSIIAALTTTSVALNKNTKVTGTLESTSTLTVDAGGLVVTAGGATVTAGGLTVSASGATITGDSKITGKLETTDKLTVDAGGLVVTAGAVLIGGGATISNGLTVDSGGAAITGNSSVTGTLTASNGTTGSQVVNISQFAGTNSSFAIPNAGGTSSIIKVGTSANSDGSGNAVITFPAAYATSCDGIGGIPQGAAIMNLTAVSKTGATINLTDNAGAAVVGVSVVFIAVGH